MVQDILTIISKLKLYWGPVEIPSIKKVTILRKLCDYRVPFTVVYEKPIIPAILLSGRHAWYKFWDARTGASIGHHVRMVETREKVTILRKLCDCLVPFTIVSKKPISRPSCSLGDTLGTSLGCPYRCQHPSLSESIRTRKIFF